MLGVSWLPTRLLFQEDSYLSRFEARVAKVVDNSVVLDQTAFHPGPFGGLDTDTGWLETSLGKTRVVKAEYKEGDVYHVVEDPSIFSEGALVTGVLDWDKRYAMMRLHTGAHVLIATIYNKYGYLVTGGHITHEYGREDFDVKDENWKTVFESAVAEANEVLAKCLEVRVYWLSRDEALKIPGLVKLAEKTPLALEKIRVVEIPGVDIQADGGPHVKNTCEVGKLKLLKIENRGKTKKRIYYGLES